MAGGSPLLASRLTSQSILPASVPLRSLPYRGDFGASRPPALTRLALPPAPMPSRHALRPLKAWRYAGVGAAPDGRLLAWNLVSGVNDSPSASERTVWVDGRPTEVEPVTFAPDLSRVGELVFSAEVERARKDNLLLVRSSYRQPFGTF